MPMKDEDHDFSPQPRDVYRLVIATKPPIGPARHWVCTLSDDEPYGNYPQSMYCEITDDSDPLARGLWVWFLTNPNAIHTNPADHLHTVVWGPFPGVPDFNAF